MDHHHDITTPKSHTDLVVATPHAHVDAKPVVNLRGSVSPLRTSGHHVNIDKAPSLAVGGNLVVSGGHTHTHAPALVTSGHHENA